MKLLLFTIQMILFAKSINLLFLGTGDKGHRALLKGLLIYWTQWRTVGKNFYDPMTHLKVFKWFKNVEKIFLLNRPVI